MSREATRGGLAQGCPAGIRRRAVVAVISRTTGALMLAYAAVYTAHFVFDALYAAGPVWTVFNVISAAGIVIALAANLAHVRARAGFGAAARRGSARTPSSTPTPRSPSGSSATGCTCSPSRRASPSASTRTSSGSSSPCCSRWCSLRLAGGSGEGRVVTTAPLRREQPLPSAPSLAGGGRAGRGRRARGLRE